MNDKIFKTLSQASKDIMMNKVDSIVISYTTNDGLIHSAYDKTEDTSVVEMIGMVEVLKTRLLHGYDIVPEIGNDED